ncbi:zonular occludens toxin domain-containing protein [Thauera aromatica]|uniref:zonular occludens toxin domain-containing protein n=1 Tax=Thauera aromatica TaxID=59405 RepID=UPI001FFDD050|nr:zonular occludens toxin domain-containing protein [Thauera aromatica]MCK2088649.1 zonular occludens toxin domain-containing protein [Thauera aromatica]
MIYLHTGQPGAGKTLLTLHAVRERAKTENRPVFYAGIEILKPEEFPGWQVLEDPKKWFDCPDGAIIVHDECQTLYRPRGNGALVPEYVARFETHRHQGLDIYLITQHPMLLDSNIRRLAGEHSHIVRAFGSGMATVHTWQQVKEQCDKSRTNSIQKTVAYPKELFNAYKSATVHTHQRKIPLRMLWLLLVPLGLGAVFWYMSYWYSGRGEASKAEAPESVTGKLPIHSEATRSRPGVEPKTLQEWLRDQQPRIVGLPHTAPVYDQVTQVVTAPYPAACIASATKCICYSQQGTRLDTPEALCRQIVGTGYFVAWNARPEQGQGTAGAAQPTPLRPASMSRPG